MTRRSPYSLPVWSLWVLLLPLVLAAAGIALVSMTDIGDVPFDNPGLWWLGVAVPLAGLLFLYGTVRRRRALGRFVSEQLAPLLTPGLSRTRPAVRAGAVVLAILMLVAAILGPRWGVYLEKQKVFGVDIVVALDVSRSMLARDMQPNRLEQAKRLLQHQLVDRAVFRHANRLGLIAFAGSTSLRLPLTTDHLAFRTKLEAVEVGSAPRGGTAIAQAIRAGTDLFAKSPPDATKIILLVTDGEDHAGGPVEAAREAFTEHGVRTFTIGVGDPSRSVGAEVPGADESPRPMLHDGQIVFSKLDVGALRDIAEAGDARYVPVEDLHLLVQAISEMWRTQLSTEERKRHRPRYQWFLAAALMLLGIETLIGDRRGVATTAPQRLWQQESTA